MSIKEELYQLRYMNEYISSQKREIQLLREEISFIRGIDYSKEKISNSTYLTQEELICNLLTRETELMHKIKKINLDKEKAKEKIFMLKDERHSLVLYKRYILCEKWSKIAEDMDKGERHIYKIHGDALEEIKKI